MICSHTFFSSSFAKTMNFRSTKHFIIPGIEFDGFYSPMRRDFFMCMHEMKMIVSLQQKKMTYIPRRLSIKARREPLHVLKHYYIHLKSIKHEKDVKFLKQKKKAGLPRKSMCHADLHFFYRFRWLTSVVPKY